MERLRFNQEVGYKLLLVSSLALSSTQSCHPRMSPSSATLIETSLGWSSLERVLNWSYYRVGDGHEGQEEQYIPTVPGQYHGVVPECLRTLLQTLRLLVNLLLIYGLYKTSTLKSRMIEGWKPWFINIRHQQSPLCLLPHPRVHVLLPLPLLHLLHKDVLPATSQILLERYS